MAQRVRDILLRITGNASDAERELHDLAQDLKRFDGITAEATVDVNTQAANRKIDAAKKSVQDFGRLTETAKIDLQERAAQVKLDRLRQNLDNLQKKEITPKVEIAIGRTVAQIERVEAQLDKLDRRRVDINVDVDRSGRGAGGIGRFALTGATAALAGAGAAAQGLGLFVSAASTGIPVIGDLARLLVQLGISGAALAPVFLILVPIIGVALVGAVTLLAGAIVALGASFLAAAAGVGVLAGALAAAFGPVILVAIAAMARFAKILEAVKAAEEGTATSARNTRDALEAQADAAEAVSDAVRGIAQAELSRDQARLNTKKAEQDLAAFRKEAELTGGSLNDLTKKFTDINFRPENLIKTIRQSELGKQTAAGGGDPLELEQLILNVRQARQNEQDAIDGVSDAHERLHDARRDEAEVLEKQNDALDEQNDKLKDLTGTERRLVEVIVDLKKALTDAFRPATQRIFEGLIDFLKDIGDFAKDRRVQGGLKDIGDAIGDMFSTFGRELRRPQTREAFATFARTGARIIRTLTPVFRDLSRLILDVAEEASPWLLDVIRKIGRSIRNWVGDIDRSDIENFVRRIRRSFNIWKGIASELWGIIKALFDDANKKGDTLAEHLRKILARFRGWLDENPQAVEDFFENAVAFAKDLADLMERIATAMEKIVNFAGDVKSFGKFITGRDIAAEAEATGRDSEGITRLKLAIDHAPTKADKRRLQQALLDTYGIRYGFALGGLIPGLGTGDIVPAMLEPGEFVLKRSVAQSIGVSRLNLLNAGNIAALSSGRGGVHIENINLPPAPGHNQMGDPRHQAAQFARELRRRGEVGLSGGGIP